MAGTGAISERRRGRVIASPRARRAMRQRGIDPATVRGTGPGARIVEADVLRAGPVSAAASPGVSPHFYLRASADVTSLLDVQRQIAEQVQRACGTPLRLGDLLLRAMALALADCPSANCLWQDQRRVASDTADVGFEVQGPGGRATAVICQADRLGLVDLVRRRAELTATAGAGLPPAAVPGSATSLCDLTEYPVDEYTASPLAPSTSALAAGRAAMRPAVVENRLVMRQTLFLSMTVDQRALAPEAAAGFLGRIVDLLQRPFLLLCERPR